MAETPDLFKADPQIEKLDEGGLLLIWNEEQTHLHSISFEEHQTICGIALGPSRQSHAIVMPSEVDTHLTCASCLYFWNHGVKQFVLEHLRKREKQD